jgi:acetolactate synthase-1/2/3 large subunit
VFATAGPGVTNLITGVVDAYMDSIPMVVVIGDVRSSIAADFSKQRYNAPQEVNQAALMRPIVKEYVHLNQDMDASTILTHVDNALNVAVSGRPGPICISIPLDVQGIVCDPEVLNEPCSSRLDPLGSHDQTNLRGVFQELLNAQRPLVLLGAGVRISGIVGHIEDLIAKYDLPWCVTIGSVDLQDSANPLSVGCVGPTSQRAANTIFHAADCILALGTSFDQSVTGFNIEGLIKNKKIYLVNVDQGEGLRFADSAIDLIQANLSDFACATEDITYHKTDHSPWLAQILSIKQTLTPAFEAGLRTTVRDGFLSAYDVTEKLSHSIPNDSVIVLGISLDAHSVFNAFEVSKGTRIIVSRNLGPMGWDIPALLGASFAIEKRQRLVLITGDGSLMLNVQELSVIAGFSIPAIILVFNNDGYVSIRTTQGNFFGSQFFGCDNSSGLHIPPLEPLARGFGLEYDLLASLDDITPILEKHDSVGMPRLIECRIDPRQLREPRLVSRVVGGKFQTPTLNEMTPELPPEVSKQVSRVLERG